MPVLNCPKCSGPKTQYDADNCKESECPLQKVKPGPVRWAPTEKEIKKRGRPKKS